MKGKGDQWECRRDFYLNKRTISGLIFLQIIFFCWLLNNGRYASVPVTSNHYYSLENFDGAASGEVFLGKPFRKWGEHRSSEQQNVVKTAKGWEVAEKAPCKYWSVVTTINGPTDAITKQANLGPEWCIAIVGDKKSPASYSLHGSSQVVYFDVEMQLQYSKKFPNFIDSLPWNHFGRKSIGYLYAIEQGAEAIWDFDDDNIIKQSVTPLFPKDTEQVAFVQPYHHQFPTYNPYVRLGAPNKPVWPRGLPLDHIREEESYDSPTRTVTVPGSDIGIIQSAADHDPDVDAIYRLTMPLPFNFSKDASTKPILLPERSLTPLNAQACLFKKSAFFMLLLPVTVHGRVSDIWRGYLGQRLLWETGLKVAYSSALVDQVRNAHNYLGDFDAEIPLYVKSGALVDFLHEWKSEKTTLAGRMEDLYIALFERGYIEREDVLLLQHWLKALQAIGYVFPDIKQAKKWQNNRSGVVATKTLADANSLIAWLSMGNAANFQVIHKQFLAIGAHKVRFIYHAFDQPCPIIVNNSISHCIFRKGTSYAEGRHLLLQTALAIKDANLKYFVFFDDDMDLLCGNTLKQLAIGKTSNPIPNSFPENAHKHCWESFTDKLLAPTEQYPFIKPLYTAVDISDAFSVKYQSCNDENFKAHHRDYLWFFFPSSYHNEHVSWWFNGRSKMYLSQRCYQYAWKVVGDWGAANKLHRAYPQNEKVDRVQDLLEFTYGPLGPWNVSQLKCCHRCEIADEQPLDIQDIDPLCEMTLKARYNKWRNGTFELDVN